jgi:hypothetical protein
MDKPEQEKHIPWKVLSITLEIHKEELFLGLWKKFLSSFRCSLARIQHSWSVLVIYRFTTKSSQISSRLRELLYKLERIKRKEFLSKD